MMKNKLPCELIRDLFPSYIDDLTSDVTNEFVEEHLSECEACRCVLESMKEPSAEAVDTESRQEIDFLKKTRKKMERIIFGSILTAAAVITIVLLAKFFLIGTHVYSEYVACDVRVDGDVLTLSGAIYDENLGISSIEFTEDDGVVTASFKSVQKSLFHSGDFEETYTAGAEITEVRLDDRIIWSQGKSISAITSAVYNTRHLYVGDMAENGRTARALNIADYLGNFTNELQTSEEPYGWKLILENSFSSGRQEGMEEMMESYAYVMLAVIENLDKLSFEYVIDGTTCELSVTSEEATAFAGKDIKSIGENVAALQRLMEKTGLTERSYVSEDSQRHTQDTIQIEMVNLTEEEISGIGVSCYLDGKLYGTQNVRNADGTLIKKGQVMCFTFIPDDFGGEKWPGEKEVAIEVTVTDKDGNTCDVPGAVNVPAEFGCIYGYDLLGNVIKGYRISR